MLDLSERDRSDLQERRVVFLEFLAAFAVLCIVALVLYMVFSYKPAV